MSETRDEAENIVINDYRTSKKCNNCSFVCKSNVELQIHASTAHNGSGWESGPRPSLGNPSSSTMSSPSSRSSSRRPGSPISPPFPQRKRFSSGLSSGSSDHEDSLNISTEDANRVEKDQEIIEPPGNSTSQSPYINQNWLKDMLENYRRLVIERCSADTKEAVEADEDIKVSLMANILNFHLVIQDKKRRGKVENEILNTTVVHLATVFGEIKSPGT